MGAMGTMKRHGLIAQLTCFTLTACVGSPGNSASTERDVSHLKFELTPNVIYGLFDPTVQEAEPLVVIAVTGSCPAPLPTAHREYWYVRSDTQVANLPDNLQFRVMAQRNQTGPCPANDTFHSVVSGLGATYGAPQFSHAQATTWPYGVPTALRIPDQYCYVGEQSGVTIHLCLPPPQSGPNVKLDRVVWLSTVEPSNPYYPQDFDLEQRTQTPSYASLYYHLCSP
jgi:hypothetical protein